MTSAELLRLLLDHDRLAVAGALASRQMTTTEIADYTGRGQRIVLTAIGDLRAAGLVMVDGDRYGIDVAALRDAARSAAELDVPMDPIIGYGMTEDEQVILRRFFSGRTLKVPRSPRTFSAISSVIRFEVPTKPATNGVAGCS